MRKIVYALIVILILTLLWGLSGSLVAGQAGTGSRSVTIAASVASPDFPAFSVTVSGAGALASVQPIPPVKSIALMLMSTAAELSLVTSK